jgi:hypothetical protein
MRSTAVINQVSHLQQVLFRENLAERRLPQNVEIVSDVGRKFCVRARPGYRPLSHPHIRDTA